MAVAEIFINAFITVLFEKLASADLIRLAPSARINSQLNKWKKTLFQIQAVLADAGQKQIRERAVQLWLHHLQDLAYDIDDVLDDLATEAMRRRLSQESNACTNPGNVFMKVIIPSSCCTDYTPRNVTYGRRMSSRLDEITTKLCDLVEAKNVMGLRDNVERSNTTSRRPEETSLVDESRIVGRESDKHVLLQKLLSNETCNQNVSILSIVGLGGVGKTTLAQVLYNEKKVKDHFELRAWVCVSEEFDVFNISMAIFQAVGGEDKQFSNLDLLHVALTEKLSKKRFLLVLDDIWNEDYKKWELLQRPFVVGSPGSKIIATTRKNKVPCVMDSIQAYNLEVLSNDEALSLFAQHALGEQNFDKHPTLKLHGEGIMKKCDGLPLALITLGRMLRTKPNDKDWEELLNSEIWNLSNETEILPALRLSYYDLPPHLKQVFAYCSLFPKDYVFNKDEQVLMWMAEGFLYQSNGNKSMESLGRAYFEELESRCFFQHSTNEKSRYIMHDLINDLATSVAGEFFFRLDVHDSTEGLDKSHRYVSLIHKQYGVYKKFMSFQRAQHMRTFLTMSVRAYSLPCIFLSNQVLVELLPQLQFLRVLSFTNCSIREIPQSIGDLKHLRYLNFSRTNITSLPEQVSDLHNLQSLLLSGCCELSSLPNCFRKLTNLRHLDIDDTPLLKKMPMGIGELTSLQTLSKVIIGGANGFKLTELKGLLHLQGRLSIIGLHKVINAVDAREAYIQQKKCLDDLEMEWIDVIDDSRSELVDYDMLEGLKPHNKLRNLKICFYMGTKFPSWVGDPSFVQLTQLTLRGCRCCRYLPTLGHLTSLRKLAVGSMNGLKILGSEFLRPTNCCNGIAFPSLEVLEFDDMQGWEIWSTNVGDDDETSRSFPCLCEISIVNCPNLTVVLIGEIPSLRVLNVEGCSERVFNTMVCLSSSILRLTMDNIKGLTQLDGKVLEHLGAAEYLCIRWCEELRYLWESETEACKILVSLRVLRVESCENLISLGKKDVKLGIIVRSIREVHIRNCHRLETYNCPKGIERLVIFDCPSVTSLIFPIVQDLPPTLKILDIWGCDNLEEICLLHNFLSSLKTLLIQRLPNLRSFPEQCLVHLANLTIWKCDNMESFGFLPLLCLRYLQIINCKNLKSFPYEQLHSLASLEVLTVMNCPSLDSSFPCGLWPPNLSTLRIGGLKKCMSQWGLQNFSASLTRLSLHGENSGVVSFAKADARNGNDCTSSSFLLPSSLTFLQIHNFMDLESLSNGLQHLVCLEELHIGSCPKLRDLPETLIPLLSCLSVVSCHKLQKRCHRKGNYRHIISHIPSLDV